MLLYTQYRDYIYLFIATYGSIAYYYFNFDNKVVALNVTASFLLGDIVLNNEVRPDILLHHILSSFSVGTYAYYKYTEYLTMFILPPLGFQVSTIFLCINSIYDKSAIVQLLFILTFIYFRIYRHYVDTIIHPDFEIFSKEYTNLKILPYIFYSLNVYWLCFIIKKVVKSLKLKYNNTEWILQYLLCLNIPITFYKYIQTYNPYLLIDVAGNIILSIGNYKCHHDLLLNYQHNKPLEMKNYLYDHVGIRVRAALSLTTYFIINNNYNVLYASVINHIGSSIVAVYMTQNKTMDEFNKSQLKVKLVNWLQVNIIIDALIMAYMYNSLFKMYIMLSLIGYVYNYQLFYDYSHVVFHMLLICQNCLIYSFSV